MKMKNRLTNFSYILETQLFKFIFLLMIIASSLGVILTFKETYINANIIIVSNSWINSIFILILLISTSQTYFVFDKNNEYVIRLKNKRTYLKELTKQVIFNNTLMIIIQFTLITIFIIITIFNGIKIVPYSNYQITNLEYLLFYIIRTYFIYLFISIFNVLILKIINNKVVIAINGIICALLINSTYSEIPITKINDMPIYLHKYLGIIKYENFHIELYSSLIFLIILIIVAFILYKIVYNNFKTIGD